MEAREHNKNQILYLTVAKSDDGEFICLQVKYC